MLIHVDSFARYGVVALLLLVSPATAQTVPGDILNCKNITDNDRRLACFDTAMAKDRTVKVTAPVDTVEAITEPEKPKSNWQSQTDASAMTDDTNHFLSVTSTSFHQCRQYGSSGPITLTVRCMEDTTSLIIYGDCHLASGFDGYGDVTWRTDSDKAITRSFEESTDNAALGLWSGRKAIPAIKELFGKDRLVTRFTPFGMSPIEVTFDIAGLEEAIGPLREECGW